MKVKRKIVEIDEEKCDGCGQCIPACAEGAIMIEDGKARLVAEKYCDGLGACLGECPNNALTIVEQEADEFDEEAVEEYVKTKEADHSHKEETMACGCPSTLIQSFTPRESCDKVNRPVTQWSGKSALSHWPVQIKLVPSNAPFLKGADLLVAADCTPFAYPTFHRDFLERKVLLVGCPKFDDVEEYVKRFADIFATAQIKSITAVIMEVPCCSGLPLIIKKGMNLAGKDIPVDIVVISTQGEILKREKLVA
ncbi:MAG: 4Fe-4S binding protein [Thermodesulfobacteriota bacterium]|nr:4Fe-4S binding protein [Thermodesulfobacteriota bacterium]